MRKLYAVLTALAAFAFNANAQDNLTVHEFQDTQFYIDLGGGIKENYNIAGV